MLKAIDVQQVIIQIEHTGHPQQQHPETQQRYLAIRSREEKKLMKERVNDADEVAHASIQEEGRREGNARDHMEEQMKERDEGQGNKMRQHKEHINIMI